MPAGEPLRPAGERRRLSAGSFVAPVPPAPLLLLPYWFHPVKPRRRSITLRPSLRARRTGSLSLRQPHLRRGPPGTETSLRRAKPAAGGAGGAAGCGAAASAGGTQRPGGADVTASLPGLLVRVISTLAKLEHNAGDKWLSEILSKRCLRSLSRCRNSSSL